MKVSGITLEGPPIFLFGAIAALIFSSVRVLRDARERGKSQLLAFIFLIAAGWPLSILWWMWLRPPRVPPPPMTIAPRNDSRFRER